MRYQGLRFLLQSREFNSPTECVPGALTWLVMTKRVIRERDGSVATPGLGQLVNAELRLFDWVMGDALSGSYELVPGGYTASNLQSRQVG